MGLGCNVEKSKQKQVWDVQEKSGDRRFRRREPGGTGCRLPSVATRRPAARPGSAGERLVTVHLRCPLRRVRPPSRVRPVPDRQQPTNCRMAYRQNGYGTLTHKTLWSKLSSLLLLLHTLPPTCLYHIVTLRDALRSTHQWGSRETGAGGGDQSYCLGFS